jgi:hypothetical protein
MMLTTIMLALMGGFAAIDSGTEGIDLARRDRGDTRHRPLAGPPRLRRTQRTAAIRRMRTPSPWNTQTSTS